MSLRVISRPAYLIIFLSLILLSPVCSQVDTKSLDKYFAQALEDWDVPGMAIGIVKDNKIVMAKGYGVLEINKTEKVDEHSMFAIASNTKAFIAAALATLVDEGKLSWQDKVVDYLPYFQLYDAYSTQEATIEDLLSHRLGLGTFSGDVIWYKSNYTAREVIERVKFVPQAYSLRAGYGYSNLMFITAGEVIKAVTGQSWDEYIKAKFFEPIDMDRTETSVSDLTTMTNVSTPHKPVADENVPIPYATWDNMGAAGGIISNVDDMCRWMMLQLNQGVQGQDTLFTENRQIDMWTPHNSYRVSARSQKSIPSRHFSGYGLGWGLSDYKGNKMISHGGGYDGMYSRVTLIPDQNLGIVVLTNSMKGISTPLSYKTIDAFLKDDARDWSKEGLENAKRGEDYRKKRVDQRVNARATGTKPTVAASEFHGTYHDDMYGDINIGGLGEVLTLSFEPAPKLDASLTHWHYNTYKINWKEEHAWFTFGTVQFVLDNNRHVIGIEFDVPNDDIFFEEIKAKKVK